MSAIEAISEALALACSDYPQRRCLKSLKSLCGKRKFLYKSAKAEYLRAHKGVMSLDPEERRAEIARKYLKGAYEAYLLQKHFEDIGDFEEETEAKLNAGQVFFLFDDGKFRVKKGYKKYILDCDKEYVSSLACKMEYADGLIGIRKCVQCYAKDVNDRFRADWLPSLVARFDKADPRLIAKAYSESIRFQKAVYAKCQSPTLQSSILKSQARLLGWKRAK